MIRKYHNHRLQTSPWHRKDLPHNKNETPGRQTKQSNQLSLLQQDDCKTRTITNSHNGSNNQSKRGCKDQESIQSSTKPDPGYQWESDKHTVDTTNESQEVSPFPAGDHKAHINRRAQNIANTRQNENIKDPQKKYLLGTVSKIFYWRA